jgi:hypothetical protein
MASTHSVVDRAGASQIESHTWAPGELKRMRRSARRHLRLALVGEDSDDLDAALAPFIDQALSDRFIAVLDRAVPDKDAHGELYAAAMALLTHESDVAYLFGVLVGEAAGAGDNHGKR